MSGMGKFFVDFPKWSTVSVYYCLLLSDEGMHSTYVHL